MDIELTKDAEVDIFYRVLQSMVEPLSKQGRFFSTIKTRLLGSDVIDSNDEEEIRTAGQTREQAMKFVDILSRKDRNNLAALEKAFTKEKLPVLAMTLRGEWKHAETEYRRRIGDSCITVHAHP